MLAELRAGLADLRDLAHGLHPAVLSDRGLGDALSAPRVPGGGARRAPRRCCRPRGCRVSIEAAAYFTVCEALTNVAKYASATRAWVTVERRDGHLDVEVGDDGVGGADPSSGSGLLGLRDRIAAVNGTLDIESRPAAGTVLRVRLPVAAERRGPAPRERYGHHAGRGCQRPPRRLAATRERGALRWEAAPSPSAPLEGAQVFESVP